MSKCWIISSLHPMDGITVLLIMEFFNPNPMKMDPEMTDLEMGSELQHDLGDYPDGFNPSLYDL